MIRRRSARGSAPTGEPLAMARLGRQGSRPLSAATLVLALILPRVASAGWGNENWGEMVWGASAPQIPAMTVGGIVATALLIGLSRWFLATRLRRAKRPLLKS